MVQSTVVGEGDGDVDGPAFGNTDVQLTLGPAVEVEPAVVSAQASNDLEALPSKFLALQLRYVFTVVMGLDGEDEELEDEEPEFVRKLGRVPVEGDDLWVLEELFDVLEVDVEDEPVPSLKATHVASEVAPPVGGHNAALLGERKGKRTARPLT